MSKTDRGVRSQRGGSATNNQQNGSNSSVINRANVPGSQTKKVEQKKIPVPIELITENKEVQKETEVSKRYSDSELEEFEKHILNLLDNEEYGKRTLMKKYLAEAQAYDGQQHQIFRNALTEDGMSESNGKEAAMIHVQHFKKIVDSLEYALIRIKNKTYGICSVTGKLIPKARLMAVPGTTKCIEVKNAQESPYDMPVNGKTHSGLSYNPANYANNQWIKNVLSVYDERINNKPFVFSGIVQTWHVDGNGKPVKIGEPSQLQCVIGPPDQSAYVFKK